MNQEVKVLLGIGIITLIILVGAIFFISKPTASQNLPATSADPNLLIKSSSHQTASDSAKVTIVEFGDYQCPACGFVHPIVKQVLNDYSGKVNFIFRNFPLPQHPNSQIAAEAAEAAGAQGKFWQMHDKLYETQSQWSDSDRPLDIFISFAKELGLDTAKFQNDVTSKKYASLITQDKNDGNSLGINVTPTFFINGQKIEGAPTYNDFKTKIDSELKP